MHRLTPALVMCDSGSRSTWPTSASSGPGATGASRFLLLLRLFCTRVFCFHAACCSASLSTDWPTNASASLLLMCCTLLQGLRAAAARDRSAALLRARGAGAARQARLLVRVRVHSDRIAASRLPP